MRPDTAGDYGNDGWPDIYVTNYGKNRLYRNNHDGTFTDVAEKAGVTLGGWSTGTFLLYSRTKRNQEANRELAEFQRLQEMEKMVRREEAALSKSRRAQSNSGQSPTTSPIAGEPR